MNGFLITIAVLLILGAVQFMKQRWARILITSAVLIMWSWIAHLQNLRDAKTINQYSFATPNIIESLQHSATQQNWIAVSKKIEIVKENCNQQDNPHIRSSFLLCAMDECWSYDAQNISNLQNKKCLTQLTNYELQASGLGGDFLDKIDSAIDDISKTSTKQ